MNQPGAEHAHHVTDQLLVPEACGFGGEIYIYESRRNAALGIADQFHDQYAAEHAKRLRHAHAGITEAIQGVDLGALPFGFLHGTAATAAAFHCTLVAAAPPLPAFLVGGELLKAALFGGLVNLGAA